MDRAPSDQLIKDGNIKKKKKKSENQKRAKFSA